MKIYLSPELFAHRRGRFLVSLLAAELIPEQSCPDSGMLLMIGEQFQEAEDQQERYESWARQPGCALLLLPPYKEGQLIASLDWSIGFASGPLSAPDKESLPQFVAAEMVYCLEGIDGSSEPDMGHLWSNHSLNTRYWKAHVNSGLVAATTLPLWSISLMDHADLTLQWLAWLYRQSGKVSPLANSCSSEEAPRNLTPHDYTVLVCCYGLGVSSPATLTDSMRLSVVPIINLDGFDLPDCFSRLQSLGLLDENGLTSEGLDHLRATHYWVFAEHLKGAA